MSSAGNYARKLARLRSRIFGEVVRDTSAQEYKVVTRFSEKPVYKDLPQWYPPIDKFNTLLHKLRNLGLYRDEHLDFADNMRAHRRTKGTGPPRKGEGKRSKKNK